MKCWILEGFVTREQMERTLADNKALLAKAESENNANHIECAKVLVASAEKRIAESPEGYWLGYQGKSNYKTFCYYAQQTMRHLRDMKFRVVTAEIPDDAETWWGYENPVENDGVRRYLYATL